MLRYIIPQMEIGNWIIIIIILSEARTFVQFQVTRRRRQCSNSLPHANTRKRLAKIKPKHEKN